MPHFQIDAVRLVAGGNGHEHITHIFGPVFGWKTRLDGVSDIFYKRNSFYTQSSALAGQTPVGRVANQQMVLSPHDYLRTYSNGIWNDNLLSLPRR
jgi:hypothetical protein